MDGKNAILNLLAINAVAKYETWYDEPMITAMNYAIATIAEKEGIDIDEIISKR